MILLLVSLMLALEVQFTMLSYRPSFQRSRASALVVYTANLSTQVTDTSPGYVAGFCLGRSVNELFMLRPKMKGWTD